MLTTARDTFARVYSACAMRRLDPDKPGTRQWQAQTAAETKVGTSSPRQHQVASHAAHLSGPSEFLVKHLQAINTQPCTHDSGPSTLLARDILRTGMSSRLYSGSAHVLY